MEVEVLSKVTGKPEPYRVTAHLNWSFYPQKRDLAAEQRLEERNRRRLQETVDRLRKDQKDR
jgi:hypothetical protein